MNLAVDVISDVICPWCYIGKRRLETAIAAVGGVRRESGTMIETSGGLP